MVLSLVQILSPSSYLSKELDSYSLVPRKSFGKSVIPSEPVGFAMDISLLVRCPKRSFVDVI